MHERITGFDWDEGNREKCRKHGVSLAEIEDLFKRTLMVLPDEDHSITEVRYRAIGRNRAGRYVFIVYTLRDRDAGRFIRPISARYMHGKEIARYGQDNPDLQDG